MRIELPECTRCCVCIPLRHGILIFGYLNLGFTLFLLGLEIWLHSMVYDVEYSLDEVLRSSSLYMYRGVGLFSQLWFILIIYGLEIAFNITLLVGAHMKRPKLIRAYYYFGITTSLAAFVSYIAIGSDTGVTSLDHYIIEFGFALSGLILQVYLLFLIRSELKKLEDKSTISFVNHASGVYIDTVYNADRSPL